jgi:predicted nucleic acid-binding protein
MMDIVVNASPIILLHKINRLHLLNALFDAVYIPMAVLDEIAAG